MGKLAVIVPLINEYPQALFTLRSIYEEVKDINHDIIVVDNHCANMCEFCGDPDKGHTHIPDMVQRVKWFRYLKYDKTCSHWQAKDYAVQSTDADTFLFLDAHVVPGRDSIRGQYECYTKHYNKIHGTLHLPLTYHILENTRLKYKFVPEMEKWFLTYRFETLQAQTEEITEVPCMSMCGAMMSREVYDAFGGWGEGYIIYGGGENDMNFTLATLGYKHWLYNPATLHHHGEKRGYKANQIQIVNNRAIAAYKYGGEKWLKNYLICSNIPTIYQLRIENLVKQTYANKRASIASRQTISIEDWICKWS